MFYLSRLENKSSLTSHSLKEKTSIQIEEIKTTSFSLPHITNVMASSLNGVIASTANETHKERRSSGFCNEADNKILRSYLENCDCIIMGKQSFATISSLLMTGKEKEPTWIICSTDSHPLPEHNMWSQKIDKVVFHILDNGVSCDSTLLEEKKRSLKQNSSIKGHLIAPLIEGISYLKNSLHMNKILLFGGGIINEKFFSQELVHDLAITLSPHLILSPNSVPLISPSKEIKNIKLELLSLKETEGVIFTKYKINYKAGHFQ